MFYCLLILKHFALKHVYIIKKCFAGLFDEDTHKIIKVAPLKESLKLLKVLKNGLK